MSTSTVQDRKAPSAGTKVTPGQNAPLAQEGAGVVTSESLAAESNREGGGFSSNRGLRNENESAASHGTNPTELSTASEGTYDSEQPQKMPDSYAGTAPTYVNSQYRRDPNGPHGKNLTEGGDWDESEAHRGMNKAMNAELGSKDDPSRVAEQQFQLNQSAAGRDAGPKQADLSNKSAFDALNSETSS